MLRAIVGPIFWCLVMIHKPSLSLSLHIQDESFTIEFQANVTNGRVDGNPLSWNMDRWNTRRIHRYDIALVYTTWRYFKLTIAEESIEHHQPDPSYCVYLEFTNTCTSHWYKHIQQERKRRELIVYTLLRTWMSNELNIHTGTSALNVSNVFIKFHSLGKLTLINFFDVSFYSNLRSLGAVA